MIYKLPLDGKEPDGSTVTLGRERYGMFTAKIWEDGLMIDVFHNYSDPIFLLNLVAEEYPHATYDPKDFYD